ncbi:MAG: glycosyltransferase family 4 protein [Myxococcota bacterium]|nr:glycosyltransferase family 4 protein [Myxococcota bacterium]
MHILLLSLNYYPDQLGNAPILIGIAEGLAARGHRVEVLCAHPHHEAGRVADPYRRRPYVVEERAGVKIHRTWLLDPEGGITAKAGSYLSFTLSSAIAALTKIDKPDIIFSPSPPLTLGLVDELLARRWGVPYIYNLQDLFPEAPIRMGVMRRRSTIAFWEAMERRVLRQAAGLAVICEGFADHAVRLGVPRERIATIPNLTDCEHIQPMDAAESAFRAPYSPEDCLLLFSGRWGHSQDLDGTLAKAWRLLADREELKLLLVGDGVARPGVEEAFRDQPRVEMKLTQPQALLPSLLGAADIGLAPLKRGLSTTSVPSKILGLMAAGRPVIAAGEPDGDTARLIEEAGCGIVVTPESPSALATAIDELASDPARRVELGAAGRRAVVDRYSRPVVVERYERFFEAIISAERGDEGPLRKFQG